MRLATTTGDFAAYTQDQKQSMACIRQAGFRFLDYSFGPDYARRDGAYSADWQGYIDAIADEARRLGARFVQAHAPMGSPIRRGEYHKAFVADTIRCIDACARLGVENLVVHSGYEMGITKEECFDRNRGFFMELLDRAEDAGVNILVENFNKMCVEGMYWIDNAPDLLALIEYVGQPMFHAVWDTGHANMQEMPQDEALRLLGGHVRALHVQDNMGDTDAHIAPFFGTLNLDSLIAGLQQIGYGGYFTFEADNIFLPGKKRRQYAPDERLLSAPLPLRIKAEALLYEIGKCALSAYGLYEE